MKFGGALLVVAVVGAAVGCGKEEPKAAFEDSVEYTEEQMLADDPRTRLRGALQKLDHDDKIPENASLEELQVLLDEKVDKGIVPKEQAQKLLKVLESAEAHNERLERLDEQLFGENAI